MNNVIKMGKKVLAVVVLFFLFLSPMCFAKASKNQVTEMELLILAIMSYSNNQQRYVTHIQDDEFNAKWFAGYADPSELEGWKIVDIVMNRDAKKMDGFSVVAYKKENNVVVAFRGTGIDPIKANKGDIIFSREHPQAKHVINYINALRNASFTKGNTNIYFTGHASGGYLATFALGKSLSISELKGKVKKAVTFNGLGIGYIVNKTMLKNLLKVNPSQLVNYAVRGDKLSEIGKHFTKIIYVDLVNPKIDAVHQRVVGNPYFPYSFFADEIFAA